MGDEVAVTLHERIRSDFEARILDGTLSPGDRLPTEAELMGQYDCSRMTVNKALSSLSASGLIDRRKRAGTFVARPRLHSMVLDIPDLPQEVARRGQDYGYRLLSRKIRNPLPARADEVALAHGGKLIEIRGLHSANGEPLALETRLISLSAVPSAEQVDFAAQSPGTWLLRHIPWTEAETRISAIAADPDTARHLASPVGTACLIIERRTWRGDEQVTRVHQAFLGSAYDLVARFSSSRL